MPVLTPSSGNGSGSGRSRRHDTGTGTGTNSSARVERKRDKGRRSAATDGNRDAPADVSFSSDKENRDAARRPRVASGTKRAAAAMSDDADSGSEPRSTFGGNLDGPGEDGAGARANKRRRDVGPARRSGAASSNMQNGRGSTRRPRSSFLYDDEEEMDVDGVDEEASNGPEDDEERDRSANNSRRRRATEEIEDDGSEIVEEEEEDEADDDVEETSRQRGSSRAARSGARKSDTQFYDPEQSMNERRAVRKNLRDLQKDLLDSRGDYMKPDSDGLKKSVKKANEIFQNVKQTSEATLDSRFLVQAGDLGARRAARSDLGSTAGGVNIDEFISKVIRFMQRGPSEAQAAQIYPPGSTQRETAGRNRRSQRDDDDDDLDVDDELDWEYLGRAAAYPHIRRPGLPTFLLGPLSVQKKARKVTQRTQRQRLDPRDAVRPDELELEEIERNDSKNLGHMCRTIMALLEDALSKGTEAVEAEVERRGGIEALGPGDAERIMERHNLRSDGGVCLFRFAFNPRDFGQTVENMFYISFLIRDGRAGIAKDDRGQPTLHKTMPSNREQLERGSKGKNQGVFHLDHKIWKKLCKAYGVKRSVIPHRERDQAAETVTGWYG